MGPTFFKCFLLENVHYCSKLVWRNVVILAGPSVLDVINTLLRHLRTSVNSQSIACQQSATQSVIGDQSHSSHTNTNLNTHITDVITVEQQFQNAVVDAIGTTIQPTLFECTLNV